MPQVAFITGATSGFGAACARLFASNGWSLILCADIVYWAATRPAHVNLNRVEVMPVCQTFAPFAISRET